MHETCATNCTGLKSTQRKYVELTGRQRERERQRASPNNISTLHVHVLNSQSHGVNSNVRTSSSRRNIKTTPAMHVKQHKNTNVQDQHHEFFGVCYQQPSMKLRRAVIKAHTFNKVRTIPAWRYYCI